MNPPQSTPREPERLEEIVSYLDGELSAEESAQVEQRLATDEAYRQELQSIDRAWAALDELPLTTVEDRFAKTTMELVVQSASDDVDQKTIALPIQKRNRKLRDVLLVAIAGLLGCLIFRVFWQNPNSPLVADLAVIQNVDAYVQFREVDFLRQLNRRVKSENWPTDADYLTEGVQPSESLVSWEFPDQWLENIAEEERLALRAKYNRFRALSTDQQERLRQLHEAIDTDLEAEELRQTMSRYKRWLSTLPATEQYELRKLPSAERVKRIMRMLRQYSESKSLELTAEELKTLYEVVSPRVEEKRELVLSQMSARETEHFRRLSGHEKRKHLMIRMLRDARRDGEQIDRLLQESISIEKLQAFQKLPPEEKRRCLVGWIWEAYAREGSSRLRHGRRHPEEIPEQDLEEYFTEELDGATIERLLALPREKMQQQLERRYRGGIPQEDWQELLDRDFGLPPRRGPPRPGDGRRREGPMGRPGPRDRHGDRLGPPDGRPHPRPPAGRERPDREHRPPPEDV